MRPAIASLLLSSWAMGVSAGVRDVPLDELVRSTAAIVAGEVIKEEQVEVSPGVVEKTLSIEVRGTLKGPPALTTLAREGGTARVVRIRYLDGPNAPSEKRTFAVGDRGIWLLDPTGEDARGIYQAAMRYDDGREKEVREKLAALPRYEMQLIWLAGTRPPEYVFAVGKVGFRSLDAFKEFLGRLPMGSTLVWDPGCTRMGDEPLLSSQEEMERFRAYCGAKGLNFVLTPGG